MVNCRHPYNIKMGSTPFFGVILSIGFFYILLFWMSSSYSLFFSRFGKDFFHREFYECGFKCLSDNKPLVEIHFSIIGVLFIIYELEILLFAPLLLNSFALSLYLLYIFILSFFILGLSYWYEWERFGLSWLF